MLSELSDPSSEAFSHPDVLTYPADLADAVSPTMRSTEVGCTGADEPLSSSVNSGLVGSPALQYLP